MQALTAGNNPYDSISELKNTKMSIAAELAEKRLKIARYDLQDLQGFNIGRLRELASGVVPGGGKLKKAQLVEELLAATKTERVVVELIPDTPLEVVGVNRQLTKQTGEILDHEDLAIWCDRFWKEFRALVQARWSKGNWDEAIHGDIAAMAYRVISWLNNRPGKQNNGNLSNLTKLRYRTHIINLLTGYLEAEKGAVYFTQLESCLEMLKRQIKIQLADVSEHKKGLQERRVAQRRRERETISFKPLHEFAVSTLSSIEKFKARDWKRVSVALALATGRRSAEIHRSATMFEYVDKWHVEFTGQLKAKGDAGDYFEQNPSYKIPVLVDASLVVKAHQWLKDNGKTVEDSDAAHRRYSGDLSDFVKVLRGRWGIAHEFFTYKGLRAIYADVSNQVFNDNDTANELFLAQILGHGRGELLKHGDIIDTLTPQSYKSDFRVIDVNCVR